MRSILVIMSLLCFNAYGETFKTPMERLPFQDQTIREDLRLILKAAALPDSTVDFKFVGNEKSEIKLVCQGNIHTLFIQSPEEEKTSAVYKGLRELGFLFPHPVKQISPRLEDIKRHCNKTWSWRPALKYRGFHLHTLHPSEWISGFYQNKPEIAEKTVRWLARNQQNIFDLSLLRVPLSEIKKQMRPHFELARNFQIFTGVSLGIALHQQNSYKLLSLWESYFGQDTAAKIEERLKDLMDALPLSYIVLEAGSSEFTPTDFDKTLKWLNVAGEFTQKNKKVHFTKVHVSSNQVSEKWGNYNFLPQFAKTSVGVLPHTVMFYGVVEDKAPMYGNKNFHGIRDFMVKEKSKRPTWYYPETSYWVGMDVDIPLFLTDYFRSRAEDVKFLYDNQIEGQLNFTTGHALGYWLFDWNLALINDLDYQFDPMTALRLLDRDIEKWKAIMEYQKDWYKGMGIISILSSANLQDELSETHRIHDRFTMKQLSQNPVQLKAEIELLKKSLVEYPKFDFLKDQEIQSLLRINQLRHMHALAIREALMDSSKKDEHLKFAHETRRKARAIIEELSTLATNYPELPLFKEWENPTAYQFGYAYPAATLYFWEREENQIRHDSYFPFWGNMYDVFDIVF